MEPDLVRLVLIVLGVLLVVGIYLWDRYKHAPPRRRPRRRRHMPGDLPRAEASPEVPQPDPDPELESDLGIDVDNPAPVQRRATAAKEKASGGRPVREEAPLDPEPEAFDSWSLTAETAGDPQFSMDLSFEAEGRSDYLGHHPGDTVDVERLMGHVRRLVEWDRSTPEGRVAARAHLGQHPFGAVFGDHAHMAARGQAQRAQAQADMAGALVVLRPGKGLPDAEVLLPQRNALRIGACAFAQHLGQGEFGEIQHISDPLRIANP